MIDYDGKKYSKNAYYLKTSQSEIERHSEIS
jgi:hypothetical protein